MWGGSGSFSRPSLVGERRTLCFRPASLLGGHLLALWQAGGSVGTQGALVLLVIPELLWQSCRGSGGDRCSGRERRARREAGVNGGRTWGVGEVRDSAGWPQLVAHGAFGFYSE